MSPTHPPTPLNPSQAVERIREIIVGRHLERLEQRISQLESAGPMPAAAPLPRMEDRVLASEAKLEALQDHVQRLGTSSREATEHQLSQQQETQRLAQQIQQVAAMKATDTALPAINQLERKIGTWLVAWQNSFQTQLNDNNHPIAHQLRSEVVTLWENTESQLTRLESRLMDRDVIEERFRKIAAAARALADSASPIH
ncbi:MAG: hypothetical protein WEB53_10775 [Akkermansiaceae bacterium]